MLLYICESFEIDIFSSKSWDLLSSEPPRGDSSATESRFATCWVIASPFIIYLSFFCFSLFLISFAFLVLWVQGALESFLFDLDLSIFCLFVLGCTFVLIDGAPFLLGFFLSAGSHHCTVWLPCVVSSDHFNQGYYWLTCWRPSSTTGVRWNTPRPHCKTTAGSCWRPSSRLGVRHEAQSNHGQTQ